MVLYVENSKDSIIHTHTLTLILTLTLIHGPPSASPGWVTQNLS